MKEIKGLDKLKAIELSIMKEVYVFCEKNLLDYYLNINCAVRHHGFIPWDDDIDIFMNRLDYNRFLKSFPGMQNELCLEIVNHKSKIHFERTFSKVIDTNTILIESQSKTDDAIGVFVDIWPLDGMPKNLLFRKLYLTQLSQLKSLNKT